MRFVASGDPDGDPARRRTTVVFAILPRTTTQPVVVWASRS